MTVLLSAAPVVATLFSPRNGPADMWAILGVSAGILLLLGLGSLWYPRLEVTAVGLAVRTRVGAHGARWEQITSIEAQRSGELRIVVEQGWFELPLLGRLRGPDAPAIRQIFADICLLRGLTVGRARFRGFWSKGTRLPRGK